MVPVLLRTPLTVLLFFAAAVLIFSPVYVRERQFAALVDGPLFKREDVVLLVNASRAAGNLSALSESSILNLVAEDKARDMAGKGYFAHVSPENKSPWDFLRARNYLYTAAGENLATDFVTAREAHDALMGSMSHRANILNKLYTEIGVAVLRGTYEEQPTVFVVQYFGKPKAAIAKTASKNTPATSGAAVPLNVGDVPTKTTPSGFTAEKSEAPARRADVFPANAPRKMPAVLGTTEITGSFPTMRVVERFVREYVGEFDANTLLAIPGRVFAFGIIGMLLIAFFMYTSRMRIIPKSVVVRLLVLTLMFGYIGIKGAGSLLPSSITPVSYSTVSLEAKK